MPGQGIQYLPLSRIPEKWDPKWFAQFCREVLALADTRNAIEGSGITITGQPGEPATVSTSADLTNLLLQTFVLATPSGFLNFERVLAGAGGLSIVDGGANGNITVTVNDYALTLGKLIQLSTMGVLGNPTDVTGAVQNIQANGDKSVLHVNGVLMEFTTIDSTYVSDFAEAAQDAVGGILTDSTSIDFTYNDGANTITATVITANPTALIGLAAVNGTAATPMRSDAAPALSQAIAPTWTGKHIFTLPPRTPGYTVATLPAGAAGDRAYVTDATAPTFLGALVGGGAVVCPVFHNGTAWVSA